MGIRRRVTARVMIDLHTHSTVSDGTDTPARVVELGAAAGLHAIALTDHDTLEHIPAARAAADALAITLVPGCELSCEQPDWVPGDLHILVYFVEPGCPLDAELGAMQAARGTRNERMVARLNELGVAITVDDVLAAAGNGVVGRPHIATAMIERGYATSVQDAFDRFLSKGQPAYVERDRLDPATAIALAHASGGVAVVAHAGSLQLDPDGLDRYLGELAALGLDGLECEYARYDRTRRDELLRLAERHGLAPTGGSDYHGSIKPDIAVGVGTGDLTVPDVFLTALAARRP